MPWLPLYCAQDDLLSLLRMLGDDIAFIVPDSDRTWRAVAEFVPKDGSRTALWHVPSGPLPLPGLEYIKPNGIPDAKPDTQVEDPRSGWTEERTGADFNAPYFGPGHPGVFWLNLRISGRESGSECGMSSFEWIGNRYPCGAPRVTQNRWAKLRRQIAKVAQKAPRGGLGSGQYPEIWAFENALKNLDTADINPA